MAQPRCADGEHGSASRPAAGLLISVRNAAEAQIARAGGAALIDVKEPLHGALGRADDATIAAVIEAVAADRPVSAALGELAQGGAAPACAGLRYVKWGLAGLAKADWSRQLERRLARPGPQCVVAAYADWQCAVAPPVEAVACFACRRPGSVLLVDTHCKDAARLSLQRRPTLLDWMSVADVIELCDRCRSAGVEVALAGSLGLREIELLLPARPTWFAVRGAVCAGAERSGAIDLEKVQALAALLQSWPATCAG